MEDGYRPRAFAGNLGVWTPQELAQRIISRDLAPCERRQSLQAAAYKFHSEMDCRGPIMDELVHRLGDCGSVIVRLAHQPNFLPYLQIGAQTIFLSCLAREIERLGKAAVALVLLVDYDIAESRWMRTTQIPDVDCSGQVRRLSLPLGRAARRSPANHQPPPTADARLNIERSLLAYAKRRGADAGGQFLIESCGLHRSTATLADFNAYMWLNLSVRIWGLPLLFLRLSDLLGGMAVERMALAEKLALATQRPIEDHFWGVCAVCRSRNPVQIDCCACRPNATSWLPRVLLDDLGDYALLGASGGTAYDSGREHLTESHAVAEQLGLAVPIEACWRLDARTIPRPSDVALTDIEAIRVVQTGRSSMVEHLLCKVHALQLKTELERAVNTPSALTSRE